MKTLVSVLISALLVGLSAPAMAHDERASRAASLVVAFDTNGLVLAHGNAYRPDWRAYPRGHQLSPRRLHKRLHKRFHRRQQMLHQRLHQRFEHGLDHRLNQRAYRPSRPAFGPPAQHRFKERYERRSYGAFERPERHHRDHRYGPRMELRERRERPIADRRYW